MACAVAFLRKQQRGMNQFQILVGISLLAWVSACSPNNPERIGLKPAAPGDGIACTQEAKLCPNGSYVSRNSSKGCAFDTCRGER